MRWLTLGHYIPVPINITTSPFWHLSDVPRHADDVR